MELSEDPSPALARGLELLSRLGRDGAQSLEKLARATGWPKSSVSRLLTSLEHFGAVARDPADRRYRAVLRLVPFAPLEEDRRRQAVAAMRELCAQSGHTVEIYTHASGELTMHDRCEPDERQVLVRARIGWHPDKSEAFALTLALLAFGLPGEHDGPRQRYWYWQRGRRVPLAKAELRERVRAVRESGLAVCPFTNANGVRRYAVPIYDTGERLWGVLSIAALPGPEDGAEHDRLCGLALAAGRQLANQLQPLATIA